MCEHIDDNHFKHTLRIKDFFSSKDEKNAPKYVGSVLHRNIIKVSR